MSGREHSALIVDDRLVWVQDDGGRAAAGFRGETGDCVTRAIAIATGAPYREIYDEISTRLLLVAVKARDRSPRNGVPPKVYKTWLTELGWEWTPTMAIGSGCQVHLTPDELPAGRLIVRLSKHVTAVLDGVVHDTHDPSREGTRCVYGYWRRP